MKKAYGTMIMAILGLTLLSACDTGASADPYYSTDMQTAVLEDIISDIPAEELSEAEIEGLMMMREEEKLARDVYQKLYELHGLRIFGNISRSEDVHMSSVGLLLEKYELGDPLVSDTQGAFTNPLYTELYGELTEAGSASVLAALTVGATIEDLDIKDLMDLSETADNEDILLVYDNLTRGSRNHMRSFYRLILRYGGSYEAQYITPALMDSILSTPMERGNF